MARYGQAFKDRAVGRLRPPHSATPDELAREIGVSASTLERWRADALAQPARERHWTAAARLDAVLTTAAMDEAAKSAWCREHGVYLQDLAHWRQAATAALAEPEEARATPQATRADRRRIKELERDLRRKDRALAETAALLVLFKKARGDLARGRGRMIGLQDRQQLARDIQIAHDSGARLHLACQVAGIDVRTLQRYKAAGGLAQGDARPQALRPTPSHALTEAERQRLVQVANAPRFADVPPARIVPMLADEGVYLASESSFARVLRAHGQNAHRGRARSPQASRAPSTHVATAPGQVWCWDMTYLPARVAGRWFHLYLIMDLYSRKIVGFEVHDSDQAEHAARLVRRTALAEGIAARADKPVLHGDNGATLKATTVLAMLHWLGVKPSYSRPRVSDDNAFVESLFRTAKYRPEFPASGGFDDLDQARQWASGFVHWYNCEHRHSAIGYVTPTQRHAGQDQAILQARHHLYTQARQRNPARWSGSTRNWAPVQSVTLNPERDGISNAAATASNTQPRAA
ncbi:IS3 family transposase [Paracidovorax citrulli]|uniref:IS3 family transposase n=1 Tax=Paracidovorax citrulli TaxID=80869 RepID=UPI001F0F1D87|nr:IS3 family transposase [Paracidovorax citrulli]UMT88122.1 IS3 family transposase [Paracidovorax citrulli]UMT88443.1 IS3 family transposase [Paracidovorax citrulli]WIY32644.1 IS3 family transposase [Paracidovorax citrulli]WIY32983.1 IS3 family transposase [Paracidovorax citrulli]